MLSPMLASSARSLCFALVAGTAASAIAAPTPAPSTGAMKVSRPSAVELRAAYDRKDSVELERLARRLGAVRLVALVERGSLPAQQAALAGLELLGGADDDSGGLGFLPRLVALADRADTPPALAAAVMDSVGRIAGRVPRGDLDTSELPPDVSRAAVDALAAYAVKEDRPAASRIAAVGAMSALSALVPGAATKLGALGNVRDVEVRSAVAALLPPGTPLLVRVLTDDGNAAVALNAASQTCRDVPAPGTEKKGDRALQRALELPTAARARLRMLVTDASLDEKERVDVIPCLRPGAAKLPDDVKADGETLRGLAQGPDGVLKKKARAYGAR